MSLPNYYKFMASSASTPAPQRPLSLKDGMFPTPAVHSPLFVTFPPASAPVHLSLYPLHMGIWEVLKQQKTPTHTYTHSKSSYNFQHFQIVKLANNLQTASCGKDLDALVLLPGNGGGGG